MGIKGGNGGFGGDVTLRAMGEVITEDDNSRGVFAQSIGGGGGASTFAAAGAAGSGLALGASGGEGGHYYASFQAATPK